MHSYYHLVPLVYCYCSVVYLSSRQIIPTPHSLSGLPTLVCFLVYHRLTRKYLALLMDVVLRFKSFSEAPRLVQKCGTRRSDSPVWAL
jgi:hypothetical protein